MKEIERKFLVDNTTILNKIKGTVGQTIKQGYLFDNKDTHQVMRVRMIYGEYILTYKRALTAIENIEVEFVVDEAKGKALYDECTVKLEKERFVILCDINPNLTWEIDIFKNRFSFQTDDKPLIVAECELQDRASQEIVLPSWIKEEVTDHFQYKNNQLVKLIVK